MATKNEIIMAELTTDPLSRGYSGMPNAENKRDDGNIMYRTLEQGVFLSDAYQYLSHEAHDPGTAGSNSFPVLTNLRELADDGVIQGIGYPGFPVVAAQNLMGFFAKSTDAGGQLIFMDFNKVSEGGIKVIDFSWNQMVTVGVLSQVQLDTLKLLSDVPISRWTELGVSPVTTQDIVDAGG